MHKIITIWKHLSRKSGSSLAEFAVVSALMATLAATAMPKLSRVIEKSKAQKSMKEIDKILSMGMQYYNSTAVPEQIIDYEWFEYDDGTCCDEREIVRFRSSEGKFPGQEKYTMPVGGYGEESEPGDNMRWEKQEEAYAQALEDLENFDGYWKDEGLKWRSVFGVESSRLNPGSKIVDDIVEYCGYCDFSDVNYVVWDWAGNMEIQDGDWHWRNLFNFNSLTSPFQDGHYIYTVIPGTSGAAHTMMPPILIVADLENPKEFHKVLVP
jgi:hypothetical protein